MHSPTHPHHRQSSSSSSFFKRNAKAIFKLLQFRYRNSPRMFIACFVLTSLVIILAIALVITHFFFSDSSMLNSENYEDWLPPNVEQGVSYVRPPWELEHMDDDANPQVNDFDSLDDELGRNVGKDSDDENDNEEDSINGEDGRDNKKAKIDRSQKEETEERPTTRSADLNHQSTTTELSSSPRKKRQIETSSSSSSMTTTTIIVALRGVYSSSSTTVTKYQLPHSLLVAIASIPHHRSIRLIFSLSHPKIDIDTFYHNLHTTIKQGHPKMMMTKKKNFVIKSERMPSSGFVFEPPTSIHPCLLQPDSFEVVFPDDDHDEKNNNNNINHDGDDEQHSSTAISLSRLYQLGLQKAIADNNKNNIHKNKIIRKKNDLSSSFLFLSDSVMPITPLDFIENMIRDFERESSIDDNGNNNKIVALQCGLAQHPTIRFDTLQSRLREYENILETISKERTKRNRLLSDFDDDDEYNNNNDNNNNNDEEDTDDKNSEEVLRRLFTNDETKIVDAGWNIGISANLEEDFHTNSVASMLTKYHGLNLHSGGFLFSGSSKSRTQQEVEKEEDKNTNPSSTTETSPVHGEKVDAFGSNCFIIKKHSLLSIIPPKFRGITNPQQMASQVFEPTRKYLSDVDLASQMSWERKSVSHRLHVNQVTVLDSLGRWEKLQRVFASTPVSDSVMGGETVNAEIMRDDGDETSAANSSKKNNDNSSNNSTSAEVKPTARQRLLTLREKERAAWCLTRAMNKERRAAPVMPKYFTTAATAKQDAHQVKKTSSSQEHHHHEEHESFSLQQQQNSHPHHHQSDDIDDAGNNEEEEDDDNDQRLLILHNADSSTPDGKADHDDDDDSLDSDGNERKYLHYDPDYFYEEATDEIKSQTTMRLDADNWPRWHHDQWRKTYPEKVRERFERCEGFYPELLFNNNNNIDVTNSSTSSSGTNVNNNINNNNNEKIVKPFHLQRWIAEAENKRIDSGKMYDITMCFCNITLMENLKRQRYLKAIHENDDNHNIKNNNQHKESTKTTNKRIITVPDASVGWSLSLRLRLVAMKYSNNNNNHNKNPQSHHRHYHRQSHKQQHNSYDDDDTKIFAVSRNAAAFFVLPQNKFTEELTTSHNGLVFSRIFTNFVLKPSFRLSWIQKLISKPLRHNEYDDDENFFMSNHWQKFALSLFPAYRRIINEHHHHQNNNNNNVPLIREDDSTTSEIDPAERKQHEEQDANNRMNNNNNEDEKHHESSITPANYLSRFSSVLHHLSLFNGQPPKNAEDKKPFVKIHWNFDCCSCCGFAAEIAHLVRGLSQHHAVTVSQPSNCFCQGYPSSFADTLGRLVQDQLKYVLSRLYPHEKIIWIQHTAPSIFGNVPEYGFGARKPHRFIARSMYEFSRPGPKWEENAHKADEWWVPCQFVKNLLMDEDLKVPESKIFLIPESIDTKFYDPIAVSDGIKMRFLRDGSSRRIIRRNINNNNVINPDTLRKDDVTENVNDADEASFFRRVYGVEWNYVYCNRPPTRRIVTNHHFRHRQHLMMMKKKVKVLLKTNNNNNSSTANHDDNHHDDEKNKKFSFFSQFKWEPRKGARFLFQSYFSAFGSKELRQLMMPPTSSSDNNDEHDDVVNNFALPRFIRERSFTSKKLLERVQKNRRKKLMITQKEQRQKQEKFHDETDNDNKNHHSGDQNNNNNKVDDDVTLLILSGIYSLEKPEQVWQNPETFNRQNMSLVEDDILMYLRERIILSRHNDRNAKNPNNNRNIHDYFRPTSSSSEAEIHNYLRNLLKSPAHTPRFCIIGDSVSEKELAQLFRGADAFVLPTRGEGWGLPTMQAMSMGLPVISTNWGGSVDFTTKETSYLIELDGVEEVPHDTPYFYREGKKWATPSVSHLTKLLKEVRKGSNQEYVENVGRKARKHIVDNYDDDEVWKVIDARIQQIREEI